MSITTTKLTLSRYHPAAWPELSCSILILVMGPTHFARSVKMSLWLFSNTFLLLLFSGNLSVCPLLPYMVMETLASVPAPFLSPVITVISQSKGKQTNQRLQTNIVHFIASLEAMVPLVILSDSKNTMIIMCMLLTEPLTRSQEDFVNFCTMAQFRGFPRTYVNTIQSMGMSSNVLYKPV